jgi:sugar transferase (PEP-CTERM system associated)
MIHIFNHYVSWRVLALAVVEGAVLLIAVQIGIALQFAESRAAMSALGAEVPAQAAAFALGMMVIMACMGLYQSDQWNNSQSSKARVAGAFLLGFALVGMVSYLIPALYPGLVTLGATTVTLAFAGSLVVRTGFRKWNSTSSFKARVLVIGTGSRVTTFAEYAQRSPNHQVVGYVALQPAAKSYVPQSQVLSLAPGDTLLSVAKKHAIDRIVLALRDRRGGGFPMQQLLECKMNGIEVIELPTFFEREYRQVMLESLNPSWMVLGDGFRQGILRNTAKRLVDIAVSLTLFVLCLPILALAALCVYLESGLPVLYRQERVGRNGRVFTLLKLRSMKHDAEQSGTAQWAEPGDARVTRVGRFLRLTRIDELPQIFNVLKGEMSLVGPRPERPHFVDQLTQQIPYYALRQGVKPGITGWAQVRYAYGASVDGAIEKLQHDLYYVKNHTLFLDIMILMATVEVVLWGKGAR